MLKGTEAQSDEIIGCANIRPSLVKNITIRFPQNGLPDADNIDRYLLYIVYMHRLCMLVYIIIYNSL